MCQIAAVGVLPFRQLDAIAWVAGNPAVFDAQGPGLGPGPKPPTPDTVFTGTGAAGKVFADARAAAADAGRTELHQLTVTVDHLGAGAGTELARLHTVVNASTPEATLRYNIDVTIAFSEPDDSAQVRFHGVPSEYPPLREALKQLLGPRQATLKAGVAAQFADPIRCQASTRRG